MTVIALGTKKDLERMQRDEKERLFPSLKIQRLIKETDKPTLDDANHFAAEIQKIGYFEVWPSVFDIFRTKFEGDWFQDVKQKIAIGAMTECAARLSADKSCFEGKKLEVTQKRIGQIFLMAKKAANPLTVANNVRETFAKVLEGHGIEVWPYLKPVAVAQAPERHVKRREHREPLRRSAQEMTDILLERGQTREKKHKAIPSQTPEQMEENRQKKVAERIARRGVVRAKKQPEKAKGDKKSAAGNRGKKN